jgi:2-polyprenyl-3-methyl-5-hydroxy-6-metoxy-1,4-benzoquinol methylase
MKERDIRPQALMDRYLELSALDSDRCFSDASRAPVACVACGADQSTHQFSKNGFDYAQCEVCETLFQSPRPPIEAFEAFYRESESSSYWAEVFFPAVAEVRREKIFLPRVERLARLCADHGIDVRRLMDVGAGYGIFLEEWRSLFPDADLIAVEPSTSLAGECRAKGFAVVEEIVENVEGHSDSADLVTCFEVLEHVYAPLAFVRSLARLARPDGWVFLSTLCSDGFDLQVLWEKSTQIFPPHHINFLSVDGFERLFSRAGLVDVSVTTPGQLDVDIVRNFAGKDAGLLGGQRFLRNLLADDAAAAAFQQFLVEQRMSSHVWVIGRKPANGAVSE